MGKKKREPRLKAPNLHDPNHEILKFTPLVKNIASYFHALNETTQLDDLIQEGFVGLLMAYKRWDKTKGINLGAFASRYIFGRIYRSLLGTKNLLHNKKIILLDLHNKVLDEKQKYFEFLTDIFDFISENFEPKEALVLELTIKGYKKGEILRIANATSVDYDAILNQFRDKFVN